VAAAVKLPISSKRQEVMTNPRSGWGVPALFPRCFPEGLLPDGLPARHRHQARGYRGVFRGYHDGANYFGNAPLKSSALRSELSSLVPTPMLAQIMSSP
jgi:hypothetical protein